MMIKKHHGHVEYHISIYIYIIYNICIYIITYILFYFNTKHLDQFKHYCVKFKRNNGLDAD